MLSILFISLLLRKKDEIRTRTTKVAPPYNAVMEYCHKKFWFRKK